MLTAETSTKLTDFESECRMLAAQGKTPKQIAVHLGRSVDMVVRALNRGYQKLRYETKG